MSLNGLGLRQHVVEFIPGTGIVTDGITDATSVNGPWNWMVPNGVAQLMLDAVGAGQGGQAGGFVASMISAGGGGGGGAGIDLVNLPMSVRPNSVISVSVGVASATADVAGSGTTRATAGGNTVISGFLQGRTFQQTPGAIKLNGGNTYQGVQGGASTTTSTVGSGGVAAGANAGNTSNDQLLSPKFDNGAWTATFLISNGGGGAAAGTTVGGNGIGTLATFTNNFQFFTTGQTPEVLGGGAGTAVGGVSRGGGGDGAPSRFGIGGTPGSNSNGGNGIGYGSGGGGGAGGFNGGLGKNGYARFTYWGA